jgi:glutathione synthase/RimK-type ligase-like ATP-grasp enzyme
MAIGDSVVFVVDAQTIDLTADDQVLADAVRRRGVEVRPVVWGTSFASDELVLIRSPFDYVDRPAAFRSWLDVLDAAGVAVMNPARLLRWNMHKGYLADLDASGVPVVPTELLAYGSDRTLTDVMVERSWSRVVVKPAIGASARHTISVDASDSAAVASAGEHVRRLVEVEDVLVQPFLESIQTAGEVSVVVIDGEIAHAVSKRPSAGDWRVQSEFGGSADRVPVTAEHERAVAAALAEIAEVPVYARVDLVDVDGELLLMELELIEPELFFAFAPESAERFADVLLSG